MDLLKNSVGGLSNEIKLRRKIMGLFVASVLLLTVGFASVSVTLKINGTASMEGRYSIHFDNYENNEVVATNTGYSASKAPIINQDKTELNNFDVVFYAPQDSVEFIFKIVNDGNINGEIENIIITDGTYTGEDSEYVSVVKNHVTHTLKYVGGVFDGQDLSVGDVIEVKEEQTVSLKYTLNDFEYEKELSTVNISGLSVVITYVQSEKKVANDLSDKNNVKILALPISGVINNDIGYSLTEDNKLTLGGISTLPNGKILENIAKDISNNDEFLNNYISDILAGKNTYENIVSMFNDETNQDALQILQTYNLTKEEALAKLEIIQNIDAILTIEFTDDVTTIVLDDEGNNKFDDFYPKTVIVSSSASVENASLNSEIVINRRTN